MFANGVNKNRQELVDASNTLAVAIQETNRFSGCYMTDEEDRLNVVSELESANKQLVKYLASHKSDNDQLCELFNVVSRAANKLQRVQPFYMVSYHRHKAVAKLNAVTATLTKVIAGL